MRSRAYHRLTRGVMALVLSLAIARVCVGQRLTWPTDASRLLSSSFCEYRPGRFHAGIDIKTNGTVGYKAFAVRPGHVSRVKVSPYGYGRVLYLVLDTGEIAVYAHLARFMESIEERVYAEQERRGRFSVDLHFRPGEFPVAQGQVIAYTGQSAASAPHLHFELRDRYNCPVNPLLFGLPVQDTRPPVIRRVAIIPMDVHSRVQNDLQPLVRAVRGQRPHCFVLRDTVQVWGRVGLAVSCFDQANGAANRFAVYSLRSIVDGREAFRCEYQRFCYDLNHEMVLDRDYRLWARGYGDFHRLFRDANNPLRFYRTRFPSAGVLLCGTPAEPDDLYLGPGVHQVLIEAGDYAGNVATTAITLLVVEPGVAPQVGLTSKSLATLLGEAEAADSVSLGPEPGDRLMGTVIFLNERGPQGAPQDLAPATPRGEPLLSFELDFLDDYLRVVVRTPWQPIAPPTLRAWHGEEVVAGLTPRRIGPNLHVVGLPLEVDFKKLLTIEGIAVGARQDTVWGITSVQLFPVTPEHGGIVRSPDGLSELRFAGGAVYRVLYARVAELTVPPSTRAPVIGKAYRFEPADVPLKGKGRLTISLAERERKPQQLAIYSVDHRGGLRYVGRQANAYEGRLTSPITSLGTFAVVRDSVPPLIASLRPAQGEVVTTGRPLLSVECDDMLSGIGGEEAIELLLDGQRVIAEYDPPRRRAFYMPRKALPEGVHRVTARVRDRCGNQSTAEHTFFVR